MTARALAALVLAFALSFVASAEPFPRTGRDSPTQEPATPGPPGGDEPDPATADRPGPAAPAPLALTLTQAVELALGQNPTVRRARETINEFNLQVRQVRADALPQLDLTLSAQKFRDPGLRNSPAFGDLPDFLPPEALGPYSFNDYAYSFRLEQPIYTFGRVRGALDAAREQLSAVKEDVRSVESVIARDVAIAYYDLLLARERLAVLDSERVSRERQLRQVKDRLALEDATRLDVLNSEVALANLRPQILGAQNGVAVSLARLNEVLNRPIDEPLELVDSLRLPDPLPVIPDYQVLLEQASRTRPELRRFEYGRRVLEAGQRVTRADTLPEISAAGNVGVNSFDVNNLGDLSFRNWNVGVFLKWKLFDGFRTSSAVARLQSQVVQSRLEEFAFRNALAREVERSSGEWKRGLQAIEVAELASEQAGEARRLAEESFQWGAASVLEILEAERQVQQAELSKAESYYVALTALADVKFLVGLRPDAPLDLVPAAAGSQAPAPTEGQQP
jgi:HAE1 family hydrophobic/amphiphilic exporter-1